MDAIHGLFRSPWLFPKKKGKPLEDGLKEVHLVYGKENTSRFLHFTCHPVKGRIQRSALVLAFLLWLLYPRDMKLRCLALSLAYSFTERGFTFFERQVAYTSLAQFLANLLYMPVLVDLYGHFLSSSWLYVLLFPVNIWVLEIVQGLAIQWTFGRNVAWCYKDYADEHFGGFIRLGHAVWWWGLGLALWISDPAIREASQLAG